MSELKNPRAENAAPWSLFVVDDPHPRTPATKAIVAIPNFVDAAIFRMDTILSPPSIFFKLH